MKLQLDTENKTIKLDEKIKFVDLIKTLNSLFPDESWREYTLETTSITYWSSPITIQPYIQPYNPNYPWYDHNPQILCSTPNSTINGANYSTTTAESQVYNIEVDLTQ